MKHTILISLLLSGFALAQDAPAPDSGSIEPAPDSGSIEPAPDGGSIEPGPDKPAVEPAPAKPAAGAATVIDVTDSAALKAALGKYVTIKGTVRDSNRSPKTAAMRIWFQGSLDFAVIIEADQYDAIEGWGLREAVGQERFARGKLTGDQGLLFFRIKKPTYFVASLAKLPKPTATKPGGKGEPEETYELVSPGAIFPVSPGNNALKPKLDTVSVKVVTPMFGGAQPEMVVTEVTAEIMDKPESGPMQATFELKPKADQKPMITTMSFLPKRHHAAGWPRHKTAHFLIDEVLADSAPPNFAAAVMIECMLTGIEIPDNLVLFGGMKTNGDISRSGDRARSDSSYIDAIKLAAASALPDAPPEEENPRSRSAFAPAGPVIEHSMLLITGKIPAGTLDDSILDEDWATLNNTMVLSCENFDQAMAVIRGLAEGDELGKAITDLDVAQKLLRERSIRMLSNDEVWRRIVAAGKTFPGNATAYAYARMRTKKVATTYSLDRCIAHIDQHVDRAPDYSKLKDRDMRKGLRDLKNEMASIKNKIHPDAKELFLEAEDLIDETEDKMSAEAKIDRESDDKVSEWVTEKYREAKKAYDDARAAAKAKLDAPKPAAP